MKHMTRTRTKFRVNITSRPNVRFLTPPAFSRFYSVNLSVISRNILPAFMFNLMTFSAKCFQVFNGIISVVSINVMDDQIDWGVASFTRFFSEMSVSPKIVTSRFHNRILTQSVITR